jgi:DNA (cytosine-5)-methyltransferase 1
MTSKASAGAGSVVEAATAQQPFQADACGWPVAANERSDFLHRIRFFPSEVASWRKVTVDYVRERGRLFTAAVGTPEHVRDRLDRTISRLREIARIATVLYGPPTAPVEESMCSGSERVLIRLSPWRELGFVPGSSSESRKLLVRLIPPNLRQVLSRSLERHALEVCHRTSPNCASCDLRNFCHNYRTAESERMAISKAPTFIDLFSGAGGLSEGFVRAGYRPVLAMDLDDQALETYRYNHPAVPEDRVLARDISQLKKGALREIVGATPLDVLIGAPPCQGFSHAGFRSKAGVTGYKLAQDERNFLFEHVVAAAAELQPRLVLLENVPGMQSARRKGLSYLETASQMLKRDAGYQTTIWRLNASAFGVPQDRVRYFLIGSREDRLPDRPVEDYQDIYRQDFDLDALPPVTLEDATFDLPSRTAGDGTAIDAWEGARVPGSRHRRYLKKFALVNNSRLLFNHTVRFHNERDLELYALLRPGEDSVHAIERYGRKDLMRYRSDVFDDKYARLRGDRPSKTIVSHLAKDGNSYIHPSQTRSISLREAARIQSFHDGYVFCGSPSDQWVQVGNSVPPVMGEALARSYLRVLNRS